MKVDGLTRITGENSLTGGLVSFLGLDSSVVDPRLVNAEDELLYSFDRDLDLLVSVPLLMLGFLEAVDCPCPLSWLILLALDKTSVVEWKGRPLISGEVPLDLAADGDGCLL